ncbi:unnamed protein product [Callosobruchus maculatus]|uniref:Cytochrome P450 n=1 Tax=Callosobruchus maculatus TaxID=64391 RepID=A0A653BJM2_CALMS|nr:unnamed protein product [Callosobruchus maculatus]
MFEVPHALHLPALAKLDRTSFTQTLLLASLLLVLFYLVNFYGKRWKWYYYSWKVPGPFAFPFIGNAHMFFGDPVRRMNGFMRLMRSHPDIVRAWLGPKLVYMVSKPEYIEKLINRSTVIDKDDFYDLFVVLFGNGILTSKGDRWKSHRKIMTRSFGQKILDSFVGTFDEQASIFVDILKKNVGRKDLPLNLMATRCHVDNICATTMGVSHERSNYQ